MEITFAPHAALAGFRLDDLSGWVSEDIYPDYEAALRARGDRPLHIMPVADDEGSGAPEVRMTRAAGLALIERIGGDGVPGTMTAAEFSARVGRDERLAAVARWAADNGREVCWG